MSRRAASWLAWSLGGLSLVMFVAGVVLTILSLSGAPATRSPGTWGTSSAIGGLMIFVPFLAFPLVGALIASRRPRNPIGWICLTAGLFWMLIVLGDSSAALVSSPLVFDALTQAIWVPPVGLLGIYLILLFPDGRLPSRRWRLLAWFSGAVMVLVSFLITFVPGPFEGSGGARNPLGLEQAPWLMTVGTVVLPLFPLCILASAISLILRFRRSRGEERQQIKWIAFAASFVSLTYLITMVSSLAFAPDALATEEAPLWIALLQNAVLMSYASVPVAVGFAVFRYRLYDIDVIINRTLVYGLLSLALATTYVGNVLVFQAAFRALTGQKSQLAVVASTLAIAGLFGPLRRRVQNLVDRRFYRRKYDAARTLEVFGAKLRGATDLDSLSEDLLGVVRETVQPAHVSLWLRRPEIHSSAEERTR